MLNIRVTGFTGNGLFRPSTAVKPEMLECLCIVKYRSALLNEPRSYSNLDFKRYWACIPKSWVCNGVGEGIHDNLAPFSLIQVDADCPE